MKRGPSNVVEFSVHKRRQTVREYVIGFAILAVVLIGVFAWDHVETLIQLPRPAGSSSPIIVGGASIIDGDSINVDGRQIRLHGIDAPEGRQVCGDANGRPYRCGAQAASALADKIGQQDVSCEKRTVDRYRRIVAVCRAGGEDIGEWMVRQGWAVAYRRYARDYVSAENAARSAKRGIWSGEFTTPEQWRRQWRRRRR